MQTAALSTFALSVGFLDSKNEMAKLQGTNTPMPTFSGTAIAIDPHHLLTSAHAFEVDLALVNINPGFAEQILVNWRIFRIIPSL